MAVAKQEYFHSLPGLYSKMWGSMRRNCKDRQHALPTFTKKELIDWCEQNGVANLYAAHATAGFSKATRPSIDRINDYQSYTFPNMQLVTWEENDKKHKQDRKTGINRKVSKAVRMLSLTGVPVKEFFSIAEAARQIGIGRSSISLVLTQKKVTAKGYLWEYV